MISWRAPEKLRESRVTIESMDEVEGQLHDVAWPECKQLLAAVAVVPAVKIAQARESHNRPLSQSISIDRWTMHF